MGEAKMSLTLQAWYLSPVIKERKNSDEWLRLEWDDKDARAVEETVLIRRQKYEAACLLSRLLHRKTIKLVTGNVNDINTKRLPDFYMAYIGAAYAGADSCKSFCMKTRRLQYGTHMSLCLLPAESPEASIVKVINLITKQLFILI